MTFLEKINRLFLSEKHSLFEVFAAAHLTAALVLEKYAAAGFAFLIVVFACVLTKFWKEVQKDDS